MKITIRPATEEDYDILNELRRQVNDLHVQGRPDIFRPGFGEELQRHLLNYLHSDVNSAIVAEAEGRVAGFALVDFIRRPASPYNLPRDFYHVAEIGVDPAFQRKGVARLLLAYMKRDALERGFDKIELDVWSFNRSALAFYEAAGFRTYRRYMELPLNEEGEKCPADGPAIHLICGRIGSGKSTFARHLARQKNAVILSSDDLTAALPCDHDASYPIVHAFLRQRALEIARRGTDVILDWGFWHRRDREEITAEITQAGLRPLWYYMDTPEAQNRAFIARRNADPGPGDFYVDPGLAAKCQAQFEPPAAREMDFTVRCLEQGTYQITERKNMP